MTMIDTRKISELIKKKGLDKLRDEYTEKYII